MSEATIPESLADPGMSSLWSAVRQKLDHRGPAARGTIGMPRVESRCVPAVTALIGRTPTARLDLGELEAGLVRLGVGRDLDSALELLGCPADPALAKRREARDTARDARGALLSELDGWPEPWASEWGHDLLRSGLLTGFDAAAAASLLADVRKFLDARDRFAGRSASRVELAARLFGSAHALDRQTKLAAATERALKYSIGPEGDTLEGRALWEAAGIAADSVSAPVLTWGVRPLGMSPLAKMLTAAADASLPVHVSLRALRAHRIEAAAGTPVLVVENPSVIENAADGRVPFGLVCTNGNPTSAVVELIDQLAANGADLHYHGDFDAAGIAICRRMAERSCTPWMMSAADYLEAVEHADAQGVPLPLDSAGAGVTPWDPALEVEFDGRRRVVHEELVAAEVLRQFGVRFGA
ncbi:TIGR02679 family protein [Candidatus Poriferisodalis sp.]|uniref:TIGR02679 family protein n=1 Tax=Candidatus Poriferisodalis sp. TaxID=3101277 RepID=UPI003B0125EE